MAQPTEQQAQTALFGALGVLGQLVIESMQTPTSQDELATAADINNHVSDYINYLIQEGTPGRTIYAVAVGLANVIRNLPGCVK